MRKIRQMMMTLSTPVRLMLTAGLAVAMFLTIVPGTLADGVSFFGPAPEFQGSKGAFTSAAGPVRTGPRDNIFLASSAGFSPFSLVVPAYSTPGAAITENFNGMGSSGTASLPADWRFGSGTAYSSGVSNATLAAGTSGTGVLTGTSAGGYYNFANGVTGSSADRAPGWLTTNTLTSPRQLFVKLTNNTGVTIGSADIAYDIEKYRSGSRAFTINFFTSTNGTTWTAQSGGDESFPANPNNTSIFNPPSTTGKALTVSGLSIAPGADLYLRWSYTGSGGSTNAQGLGIDNFSFTPYAATPGTVEFSAASDSGLEGTTKSITVNRVGGTLGAISVDYTTGGGSATGGAACTAGVDYITATGQLTWATGDGAAKSFNVQLCADGVIDTENLQLTLSNPSGTSITGTNPATLGITDNPPGTLQFFAAASNADENLPSAGVPVTRTGGSGGAVSADYSVTGGTATGGAACTAGVDYITPAPGTLNWAAGDTADQFITVQLCADLITYEGPETIQFALTNPQGGASLGAQTTTTVTIIDLPAAFFNSTPISITGGPASPYPSDIVVSGVAGAMTDVKVTLFGVSHTFPDDIDVLLVGPGGQKFLVMSDVGDNPNLNNRTFTFSDSAAGFMPDAPVTAIASGTYKPTNYDAGQQNDDFDAPAPAPPFFSPGPAGADTFNSVFAGASANGTWSLYVRDAFPTSDNGVINAGWKLEVTTSAPGPGTMELTPAAYTVGEGGSTAVTVSRVSGNVGAASVNYATGSGTATGGASCTAGVDFINASGTFSWADGEFGPKTFNVQTCPDGETGESTESAVITLSNPAGIPISGTNPGSLNIENNAFGGSTFSNHSPISIPSSGPGAPYPSTITVSGLTGNISNIRLTLNNLTHTYTGDIMMLLVGPQGQKLVPMGNVGSNSQSNNVTFKLWDGAADLMPTAPLANGEYKPASYFNPGDFTSPAPAGPYSFPAPIGADTFIGTFGGTDPNGVWSLYVSDLADPDLGSFAGGWDLEIATAAATPGTVEFTSAAFSGAEGGTAVISATRAGGSLGAISVDYATSDGTAAGGAACGAGVDYINASGTLSWADGESGTKDFMVEACVDAESPEPGETVSLTLSNPVGTTISGVNPATLTIDDNSPGTIEFSTTAYSGSEGDNLTVTATRTGGTAGAISADYATSGGGGNPGTPGAVCGGGVDYVSAAGVFSWANGETGSKTVDITLCADVPAETTETAIITLTNPTGTTLGANNPATISIVDGPLQFCNSAPITIPNFGTASQYPSNIEVSGLAGFVNNLKVTLKNVSHTYPSDVNMLLVGPGGQKFILVSNVGGSTAISGSTWALYDAAADPLGGGANPTGAYKPTNYGGNDSFPPTAPGGPYASPAPDGLATLNGTFGGTDPNGTWSLYVNDFISPDGGSIAGGWCAEIGSNESVRFGAESYSAAETDAAATVTVNRLGTTGPLTVDYATSNGTATGGASCSAGVDYISNSGTLSFANGEANKSFDVTLCDDGVFDGLKTVNLTLSNAAGAGILGTPNPAVLNINDNEPGPTISIGNVTVSEADGTASFLVTQSFATTAETTFRYTTADGTAFAGVDYTAASNAPASIPAGMISTNVVIPVLQDGGFEDPETFTVTIDNAVNAGITTATGTGTITDDDVPALYTVTSTNNANDGACNATHCSLREAITASNAVPGIIGFAPGLTGTITFSGSRPQITNNTVINGPGANVLAVSGNNIVTVFEIPNAGTAVTIRGLTIQNGRNLAFGQGGAITNGGVLTLENSVITASRGFFAGAIQTYGPLTVRGSALSNNIGGSGGGDPGCSSIGGAIDSSNDVTINIINSTISGNGVATNCSANSGAINLFSGRVVVTGSTITNNTSSSISSAIGGGSASTSIIRNSIIAGNLGSSDPDLEGLYQSQGYNLIGNPGAVTVFVQPGDQAGTPGAPLDPGLSALGNNGGTTPTHALQAGSPALDKGKSFGLATDQRGSARPYDDPGTANGPGGDGSDIGAYEAVVPVISVTGGPLNFGSVLPGGFSAEQTYTVSGMNLTANITVTAPAEFQVSTTSGSGFGTSVTLTQSGGTVATTTIYARFAPVSAGPKSGNITNESSDASAANVAVSGIGASAGTLQFTSAAFSDSETNADHTFSVTVSRTGGSFGAVDVDYLAGDGTATTADNDYAVAIPNGNLSWADGDAADKQIEITIKGDLKFETDETIALSLMDAGGGAALGSSSTATLTITNDDGQPAISVDDVTFTGDSLAPNAFTVSLSNPSVQTITVHYATANDSAVSGEDYTATSGTLTFNPGETSKDVPVAVLPDTVNEATEQFFLNLDTPVNATIADGQGVGTIPNDDPDVSFSIDDVTHTEGNSGTVAYTFTITKTGTTAQTVSVDYATVNGSAASPSDFTAVSGNLSFAPADTAKQVTVQVNGDTSFEADETFIVRLSNPVNASLADGDGLGTIQNDDAAQIFLVNVNGDTDDGTCDAANCSMREAINAVNVAGGRINFAPNVTGSISLLSALPPLASNNATVIDGPGAGVLAVKRDPSVSALRIFDVQGSGVFTISGLAINDGDVRPIGGAFNNLGGAIRIMAGHGVTINSCTFTNNRANNGAAIYNGANPATSPLTVNNSTFTANNANQSGGGIENRFSNRLTVNGSIFDANGANNFGGGIHNIASGVVFINDSTFTGNVANTGAAVNNDDTGSLTITRSIISGNHAVVGGGISNKNGGLDVYNSTISGNDASEGGGAYNHVATMNFYNSTVSGNTATSIGGGIYYTFQGQSNGTIQNCTITGNHGPNGGGVMVFNGSSVVRMGNTILAANTGSQGPDLYGTIYSSGYNILGTLGGTWGHMDPAAGDQIGQFSVINPMLAPLANNGGPTRTHLPLPGSPAIDAGNAFGETADQRGFTRTVNGTTDIGAVEIQPAPTQISAFAGSPQSVTEGTVFLPLQARVLDASNAPVGGVTVTFTAPASGPSGLFANGATQATAVTNANGVAASSALTANNTAGSFNVTAGYAASPTASFALTITETPRSISVNDVTFTGADSLAGSGFTVSLSAVSSQTVTVHYQTADGTAIAGEDYTAAGGTLTFNPGETSLDVPITILPDTVNETTEQFVLNLDTPVNATIADGQGIGTIPNDDPVVNFSIDDVTRNEGNSGTTSYTFTITKNGGTSQTASVDWAAADGTATVAGNDYQAAGGTLTFLPADTSKQVTALVNGDIFVEGDEAFTVHLSNPVNASISDADGLGGITNDDNPPSVTYVDDDWTALAMGTDPDGAGPATAIGYDAFDTVQEGIDAVTASGTVNVYAGLYRENPNVNKAVTLNGANSGIAGDAARSAEATIGAAGNTSNVITINANNIVVDGFTVDGDDPGLTGFPIYSGDDTNASYAFRSGSQNHLQLKNNIVKRVSIGFRGEGDSKDNSISGNWFDSIGSFDFGYAVTLRNNYYADVTGNKMTRVWTGVHLNNFSFAGGPPSMTVSGNNIKAYAAGLFSTLRYNAASPLAVSSNQFAPETGAVANNAGVLLAGTQDAVSVTFTGNTIANTDYGFIVTNTFSGNVLDLGATNSVAGAVKAGIYVTDNLAFNPVSTQVVTSPITAPMSLKIGGMSISGPGDTGVKVENTRAPGTEIANNVEITGANIGFFSKGLEVVGPLTNVTMTGSTIAASGTGIAVQNSGATPVSLTAHYNRIVADTYAIENGSNQPLSLENNWWGCNAGPGNTGCGASTGTGQDFNPWIVLGISASPNPIGPGGNSTVTADMTHNSDNLVPSATDFIPQAGASFNATEGSVTPPAGVIISGTAATAFTSTSVNPATASTTVDHQTVSTNIGVIPPSFSINDVTAAEGNSGVTAFTFTVTKTGATGFSSTVNYATQNGTAAAGSDFTGITSTPLVFGPSETSKEVTVLINGDAVYENNETFTVELSGAANAGLADGSGLGTLTNDDTAPSFTISDVTQNEGDSGSTNFTFNITKTGTTELPATLDWFNGNGTATSQEGDYNPATGSLEFNPEDTTRQISVIVFGDAIFENDENFFVEIANAAGATIADNRGTGTILNDDDAPTIAIDDVTMTEGDSGTKTFTFTIIRTGQTAFNGGVGYVVQDGTATSAGGDLVAASGNVGFLIADTTKTVSVTVNGDTIYEGNETFTVHLQNEAGLVVTKRDGAGTITNDDTAPTFSVSDHTFTGADSSVATGFTVTLTGATELPATVHYQTANDTAIAGEDYDATSGTLTFTPGGSATQTISVNILPDTTQEATEQFFMNLDTPVGATIADSQGVGTIPNDDAAPSFSIDNVTQGESVGGFTTFVFFVTKTGATALPSSIDYTTQPGTATAGAACGAGVDYETRSGTLNFAAGDTSQMVLVNVCGDATVETDETFTVHLSNAVNGSITTAYGLGTIQNNTTPAVQFQSATYLEDESQTAVITLVRTGDTAGASTVTFSTSNGTATGGSCSTLGVDYQAVSVSVTFDPTETTKTVDVPLCMDTLFETTFETVNLALASGTTVIGDQGTAVLNVNDTAAQFKSGAPIAIGDGGPANPYPATINVSGAPSVTGTMRITLFDLTHAHPEDLDILLVAPNGQSMVLMADSGGFNALTGNGATITFDDAAGAVLPDNAPIATRKYEPTTWGAIAPFTAPAPAGPYAMPNSSVGGAINLNSVFGAGPPNGVWQLFIRDQSGIPPLGAGQIAAGWGLQFLAPTSAEATISGRVTTASGNGIRNAVVKITGGGLAEPRVVATGAFGSYLFENLPVGQTYVLQVSAKRFRFGQPSMVITLNDAASVDFTANPQE